MATPSTGAALQKHNFWNETRCNYFFTFLQLLPWAIWRLKKKKKLQFLLPGYFTTEILKEAAHARLLVPPGPLGKAPSRPRSEQDPSQPPWAAAGWLQKPESVCNETNRKTKRVHSWCGKAKIVLWIVLCSFIRAFSFSFFFFSSFFLPTIANVNHSISLCLIYLPLLPSTLFNA